MCDRKPRHLLILLWNIIIIDLFALCLMKKKKKHFDLILYSYYEYSQTSIVFNSNWWSLAQVLWLCTSNAFFICNIFYIITNTLNFCLLCTITVHKKMNKNIWLWDQNLNWICNITVWFDMKKLDILLLF